MEYMIGLLTLIGIVLAIFGAGYFCGLKDSVPDEHEDTDMAGMMDEYLGYGKCESGGIGKIKTRIGL